MTSKVTPPAINPGKRGRNASDEFCSGSLGSIGGSAVGSSVASGGSKPKAKASTAAPPAVAASAASAVRSKSGETTDGNSAASTRGSAKTTSSPQSGSRRPLRKRLCSVDFSLSIDDDSALHFSHHDSDSKILPSADALPSVDALPPMDGTSSPMRPRGMSVSSALMSGATLERLDALEEEAASAAAKIKAEERCRKNSTSEYSKSSNSSHGTHRFLLEAFMGDGTESLVDSKAAEKSESFVLKRERLGSFDARERLGSFDARERLGSFDVRERLGSFDVRDRIDSFDGRRERLESWGGMSDLSIPMPDSSGNESLLNGGTSTAHALAANFYTNLANDLTAAAAPDEGESISDFLVSDDKIPSKISTNNRQRLNSMASISSDPSMLLNGLEPEMPSDMQEYVKAAIASVGDMVADMAVAATEAAKEMEEHSEISSAASPLIGAASDGESKSGSLSGKHPPSVGAGNMDFAVDYDAVAAAVNAAEAAAGAIDLAAFAQTASANSSVSSRTKRKRQHLPVKKWKTDMDVQSSSQAEDPPKKPQHAELPPIPESRMNERDMEIIRERARAAAGYNLPSTSSPVDKATQPAKKKAKLEEPQTPGAKTTGTFQTPRITNSALRTPMATPYTPAVSTTSSLKTPASKGQSSQKWDSMFDCLVQFIDEQREAETKGMSEEEKKEWTWDGNVPTTFKTKDKKALGRWVNNQRSAKSKGVLKEDREQRLDEAGLKWSVLASNSWNEMLEELRVYVAEQTKSGRKWDGNVPTNYRIKTKIATTSNSDEDKNLGRWVNRQRSLYQAKKLRKDRREALEAVGLKWSMLATTSWDAMFDTLTEYVESKTKDGAEWDGNVPANYKTNDDQPRALGRWINRQRSAYGKDKLKAEYIEKLNKIGLKWSVHERRLSAASPDVSQSIGVGASAVARAANSTPNGGKPPSPVQSKSPVTDGNNPIEGAEGSKAEACKPERAQSSSTETAEKPSAEGKEEESKIEEESNAKEDAGK